MKLLRFYILHSLRDMWRNRSRTIFALICVATGVSAVVALRSLGFMVADRLTTDLAELNRGDIRIYASRDVPEIAEFTPRNDPIFTREGTQLIRDWAKSEGVDITVARMSGLVQMRRIANGQSGTPKTELAFYIEPQYYPFYDTITLEQPAGVPLSQAFPEMGGEAGAVASVLLPKLGALGALTLPLNTAPGMGWSLYPAYVLTHPRPVVISSKLTRQSSLGLHLGDMLRMGAPETLYVVSGVVPADSESVLSMPSTVFLDYVYLPITDLPIFSEPALPDQIFVKVPLGKGIQATETSLLAYLQSHFDTKTNFAKELNRASVLELKKQNSETANLIDDLILVMGLSSLLIGGIGIINTMLVVVNRRMLEIAVLKTLGLKANRVTALFLVEALLMGLLGSLLGIVVGVILSYLIKDVGEKAVSLSLVWRLYPEAMFSGAVLGIAMTVLFGFLPTLIAGQVRPAVVLRPNEAQMPAAGLIQVLVTFVVMITVLGLLVDWIIGSAFRLGPNGMLMGTGALVGLFAGVIIANSGIGNPIPAYYLFRLPRRFESLENRITGLVGGLILPLPVWQALPRRERGRRAVTALLRALRQLVLLYGSAAVGAALASGILLITSNLWLPLGLGKVEPANDVIGAISRESWGWVLFWGGLTAGLGLLIRWQGRALVGLIALSSLGISIGGALGWLLAGVLTGTALWDFLTKISTGFVLIEIALALLGVVFLGYWLLVRLVGRMPGWLLMGLVSLAMIGLMAGTVLLASQFGGGALIALAVVLVLVLQGIRLNMRRERLSRQPTADKAAALPAGGRRPAIHITSFLTLGAVVLVGTPLLVKPVGPHIWWVGVIGTLIVFAGIWYHLGRSYGVDARLILHEMSGRRNRVASTLMGLSVGIAGLSLVSLTTTGIDRLLEVQMSQRAEGNLLIVAREPGKAEEVKMTLDQLPGVQKYTQMTVYQAILLEINGKKVERPHARGEADDPRENSNYEIPEEGYQTFVAERDLDRLPDYQMAAGRELQPGDAGKPVIMLRKTLFIEQLGIKVGDRLILVFENGAGNQDDVPILLTVVGLVDRQSKESGVGDELLVPPGTLPGAVKPQMAITVAQIDESNRAYMDNTLIAMSDIPGVLAVELSELTQLLENLIGQLNAIPTVVAWLALVAGTAIIANTVALATQERRRQIGVMKAVGLKGRRVLGMLMIENGLIGLIAGLIGVIVGLLVTILLVLVSNTPDELKRTLQFSTIVMLLILSIGVAIGAAALSAWSAAAEKPMNVLRYE